MSSAPPGGAPAAPQAAPAPAAPPAAVNVTIDGQPHSFPRGTLLIDAVTRVARPIPYYCFHGKLAPVGACRVCMVQIAKAPGVPPGRSIVTTACTTPVFEGMEIETMAAPAKAARSDVLAFLLANHPLDCPICDKGGECDLQDFTLGYGPGKSHFAEQKILRRKAADLGPFLVLDQERCILCQRCVRYENEVLREQNIVLKERGDRTVVNSPAGEPYPGYFSGNNTELCPVGALTSRTYRFKARPWDVRPVASVCQGCSLGCNVTAALRNERIVRLLWRDNLAVDGGWLCDRGRYGFGHTAAPSRLTAPLLRQGGELVAATWADAVAAAVSGFQSGVGILGGGRLTDEECADLAGLAHGALGSRDVDWRAGYQTAASGAAFGAREAAILDLDRADLVVLVDSSLEEEAPVLDLRLRRAAARKTAVIDVGPVRNFATLPARRVPCLPEEIPAQLADLAGTVAAAASPVVVWNGRGGEPVAAAIRALGDKVKVLVPGEFNNSRGAEAAGLLPGEGGRDARGMLAAAAGGQLHALYLVGCNPLRTFPDQALAAAALDKVPFLVVQELFLTEAAERADVVLPALGPLEKAGHVSNLAGMTQAVARVHPGPRGAKADGEIFALLAAAAGAGRPPAGAPAVPPRRVPLPAYAESARDGGGQRLLARPRLFAGGGTFRFDPNFDGVRDGVWHGREAECMPGVAVVAAHGDAGVTPLQPGPAAGVMPA